ncbi:MAG: helix-turn-helix transcriptional regulator [Clostridiaceae bacterium]|nr:helix-turn-helix transcriptional regulator [Eubacteriales bacterium]
MHKATRELLERVAKAVAAQFGANCEVVVHDLEAKDPENTIVSIENGHVSNRRVGAGSSHVALEALESLREGKKDFPDHYDYLTKTRDGRILRSSTVYVKDEKGRPEGILSINYDLTQLMMAEAAIASLVSNGHSEEPQRIPTNVNELLDDLLEQSVRLVGKPVAMMNKDDKVKAIAFLNEAGAMLITRSGDKIAKYFGISKYTLYSYLDSTSPDPNKIGEGQN